MGETKQTQMTDSGRWENHRGEKVSVFVKASGGIEMHGDTWWTCCDAQTWESWKKNHGWKKIEGNA